MGIEANNVITLRVAKFMKGGTDGWAEAHQMVTEKLNAGCEAAQTAMTGGTHHAIVERYREIVAANAARLSAEAQPESA